ncbi:ABC transporter permease [Streptomyces litchfieldiae]|uniref:ABC transporter permease n=1 Tax=Streptomyces litchfieldiae TaxID=3075543 RepID=A0ABU2MTV2_9ACTN|nr:ABC transporter permease [Streptomyces sp. DSM 44938]MDT0344965.1 ABC transporter permease [Streptomyces sp. DSM 44938]
MTLLERPVPSIERPAVGRRRAVLALARTEARRLLSHPLVVVAMTTYVALTVWRAAGAVGHPVLQDVGRETQYGPLFVGLAGLVAANSAVLRARRHRTEAQFGVLVVTAWQRNTAHSLSTLPLALAVAVIVAGQFTREAMRPGAVGHASFAELVTGPLVVVLLGVLGVLLGRLVRSSFAGPLAVLVLLTVQLSLSVTTSGWRWLAPIAIDESELPLPADLVGRPANWHALYLVGLALLAGAGASLLSGGRSGPVRGTALVALAGTLVGAVAQGAGPSEALVEARARATGDPAAAQVCVRRDVTTYCAFPDFTPWIDEWQAITEEVRAVSGAPAATRELTVRQRVDALDGLTGVHDLPPGPPGEVTASTAWGGERRLEFAASVARGLVADDEADRGARCGGQGIVIMWLAIRATPDGEAEFARTQARVHGGGAVILAPVRSVTVPDREFAVLRALLDEPTEQVARRVEASWAELTAPATSTDRAAELLGVPVRAETAADREWGCV